MTPVDDEFAGHTPGEWFHSDDLLWGCVTTGPYGSGDVLATAGTPDTGGGRPDEEEAANMRLMAAAPRILRERDDARARVALLERELAHIRDQVAASMRAAGVTL